MLSLRLKLFLLTTIVLALVFLSSKQASACGPFFPSYIYTPEDIERETTPFIFIDVDYFLNSNYEIISSGWCPQSLYPVYRDLSNNSLNQQEKEQLTRYYNKEFYDIGEQLEEAIELWYEARGLVTEEVVGVSTYKCEKYNCYINCLPDAFLTAAETLRDRVKVYNNEELKTWLEGQDEVFSNCGSKKSTGLTSPVLAASINDSINPAKKQSLFLKIQEFFSRILKFFSNIFTQIANFFQKLFTKGTVKPEKEAGFPQAKISSQALLKYDKEYQQAAAAFYKENFDEAERKFQEIASNPEHPWQAYAALALGRVYIRKGQFAYEEAWHRDWDEEKALQVRNSQLEKAKAQFENILKNDSLSSIHDAANSLVNYVNFRIDSEKRLEDAEEILLTSSNPQEIVNNLNDFSLLFSHWNYRIDEKYILEKGGDLSKWVYVWKNPEQNNLELSLTKYQQTKSLSWLLTSLKLMNPTHALKDEIIKESLKIPKDSPAYLTANYYRLKLLTEAGENKEKIRKEIDALLETIDFDESSIAKNYFNDLRMIVAEDLEESLSHSLRKVVAVKFDFMSPVTDEFYLIDKKIKQVFNELLPLRMWREIASNENIFPSDITKQIRLITFVRAILLGDFKTADEMANLLSSTDSTLKNDLSDFLKAATQDSKKFAAALFILKYHRLDYVLNSALDEILVKDISVKERDMYRRNWWCSYPPQYGYQPYNLIALEKMISSDEIQEAVLENEKIYKIVAPDYLSEVVINYALKNPDDSRVPEALHLAVMSTRFARCKDEQTSEFSQKAFQILHNNYPNNYWTNQTPYWY